VDKAQERLTGETASLERRVQGILRAAGHPELAEEGRGAGWRIVSPGWHVFAYQGAVRVDWWSEATLGPDSAAWEQDRENLASLRVALEAAGLAVTAPDASVLQVQETSADLAGRVSGSATGEM
jgi:hypothetical protein